MKGAASTALRYTLVASALLGAYYSIVFALGSYHFRQDTAQAVLNAVTLVPFNADYVARLAAWQPEKNQTLLRRALQLDPLNYEACIQLGLIAETRDHDTASAEKFYLRAAQVNHMFLPKWTLTNFYFRFESRDNFFHWARQTLQISPYQADLVFTEMWLLSNDPGQIAAAVPDKPTVLLQYITFLTQKGQFAAISPVVNRLVRAVGKGNPADFGLNDQILPAEDHILAHGHLLPALAIWRTLVEAGWLHRSTPTFAFPLTNGTFSESLLGHGFDWVVPAPVGTSVDQPTRASGVEVRLSGDEPESCLLMRQYLPLQANRSYRLQWNESAQSIDTPSGFSWHIRSVLADAPVNLTGGDILATSNGQWDFVAPSQSAVYLLTFEYARPIGKVRARGSLVLNSVQLCQK